MTLKQKILSRMYFLTFLLILAMSAAYYYLFTHDIRERSQQTVQHAYNLIFDDLHTRIDVARSQIDLFAQGSLMNPSYMVQMLQKQQDPAEEPSLWYVSRVMGYLRTLVIQLDEFGGLVDAHRIEVYGKDRTLMAVYHREDDHQNTGVYLPLLNPEAFIPFAPEDRWHAMLQTLDDIPQETFPDNLHSQYQGVMPDSSSVAFSVSDAVLNIRFTVPFFNEGALEGLCVLYLNIRQQEVERYARLSGTEVNIFAGSKLSVGTLSEYQSLPSDIVRTSQDNRLLSSTEAPAIQFSTIKVGGNSYYQGVLTLWEQDTPIGTITANLPRSLEEQQKQRFFLAIAGIAIVFSILAAAEALGLSTSIVKPVSHLMEAMQGMKSGNLDVEAPVETEDEIGRLAENFNAMTARLKESFRKIERQNEELRHLDKLKDEFLSNTSHELRTPLNGIAGLADAMLSGADGPLTEEERKHTQMILQSSRRLSKLVNSILNFSKARSEKLKPRIRAFNLEQVAELVLTLEQPQVTRRPVELSMDFPADLPKVYGDMEQVEQILTNLVGNAVKFTREGQVVVSAEELTESSSPPLAGGGTESLESSEYAESVPPSPVPSHQGRGTSSSAPGMSSKEEAVLPLSSQERGPGGELAFVKVSIRDTGIGIPEEACTRIFEAFEQVDGSASREFGGTGLGLAITKELVRQHGGEIGVESEEGVGSTFWFTLPCNAEAIPSYASPSPVPSRSFDMAQDRQERETIPPGSEVFSEAENESLTLSSQEKGPGGEVLPLSSQRPEGEFATDSHKGKRIMIVEDDLINLEVMETHLKHAGFETIRATNGKEALRVINGDTVDLILCDVMMPLVDGFTFAMRMQEKEQLRRTPLVFVSAKDQKADIIKGFQAGAVDYIAKPIESDELLLKINALLNLRRKYERVADALNLVMTQDREYPTDTDHDPEFLKIQQGNGEKILVVDDEEVNVEVFQAQLKHYNYQVIAARDGYEALQKLDAHQPDLVLLDLMMPGMLGHKVCQEMRRTQSYYDLPIIILTAKHDARDTVYGLNIGANDYMLKPFNKEELLTRIALLLRLSELHKTVIARNAELEAEIIERRQAEEALRHEVTERLKAQRELQQLNDELEARVTERTDELEATVAHLQDTQVHLVEAEKMASLAGLVTGVAHELNTPLGVCITASSYLLQELEVFLQRFERGGMTRSALTAFLDTVSRSVEMTFTNLQNVSNLVQMFKQLDVHRSGEERRCFPVKAYLEDTVRSLQQKLGGLPHQVRVAGDASLTLESFPGAFSQVISSLLMNALIHAYDDGETGEIRMTIRREDETLCLEFADDGRGVPEEHRQKLFEPFFTTARAKGGSGLGLHIVYTIVRQKLGGSIVCESEPGAGTRFLLRIPLSLADKTEGPGRNI